jgi:hypothetical protein
MKVTLDISLVALLLSFQYTSMAEDIDVDKINVVEINSRTVLETRVYHSRHSGSDQFVGYSTNGVIENDDVKCSYGERFWAEPISGYTKINWPSDKCAEEVTVFLAAPRLAYALSLSELAEQFEANGDYSIAAVVNSDAQALMDFEVRGLKGKSIKADVAKKAFRNLEKALNQADPSTITENIYQLTENGWPVLTYAGEKAITQLQKSAGTDVTGRFDLNTYKALGVKELHSFQTQALEAIDMQNTLQN